MKYYNGANKRNKTNAKAKIFNKNNPNNKYQKKQPTLWSVLFLVRAKGIEPSSKAWEAFVLPLYHTRDLPNSIQIYIKSPEIKYVIQKISVLTPSNWYATIKTVIKTKSTTK